MAKGIVTVTVYHLHSREEGAFVPRPLLWGANLDRLGTALKELRVPRAQVLWDRINTDRPVYVSGDGTAYYIFKSELEAK